ncbi:MAG: B12-binding domain-containing radical SAM protein [Cyanobacteriota bacterium]|jgi:radical SAM superfamily enzyme YgiQ (UPF0313 family)
MRVLLIYPRFPKTYWSFNRALELLGRKVLLPPLGLITVAALLPRDWELKLVDVNIRPVEPEEWAWADLVIASAMLVQKRDLARQITLAKSHQLPVAVGGPFVSSTPEAPELKHADFLILDEGEITIPLFVDAWRRGQTHGRFSAHGEKPDMSQSPIPRFDLLERQAYGMMAIQFSRGCPFQCEFCDIIVLYGRKPRTKTPGQILAELDRLLALGWRNEVFLVDDNFIGNKRNVKLLLEMLRDWQEHHGHPFTFTTEASVDLASDEELMSAMEACHFRRVFLGIETPDQDSLLVSHKLQNTRSPLVDAVDRITSHGIEVMAGFIIGFDGERPGAGERITAFVERTGIPLAMVGILQALPNTALWRRLAKEQRLIEHADAFDEGTITHLLNFVPSRPIHELATEFLRAFAALYDPISYMERVYRYCRKLATARRRSLPRWNQGGGLIRGLLTLCWRQGVRRNTRWLFWWRLLQMSLRYPQVVDEYLWLLMLNEHFIDYLAITREQVESQLAYHDSEAMECLAGPLSGAEGALSGGEVSSRPGQAAEPARLGPQRIPAGDL